MPRIVVSGVGGKNEKRERKREKVGDVWGKYEREEKTKDRKTNDTD